MNATTTAQSLLRGLKSTFRLGKKGKFKILAPGDEWGEGSSGSRLSVFDASTQSTSFVKLPMHFVHAVFVHQKKPHVAVVLGQHGTGCLVDLNEMRIIKEVIPEDSALFYGHGAFSPDGAYFYSSEIVGPGNEGRISIRRADDFTVVDQMPSYGKSPHDFIFLEDNRVMAIANHGLSPATKERSLGSSMTYVDTKTKKLIGKVPVPEPRAFASHLIRLGGDEILLGTRRQEYDHSEECERLLKMLASQETFPQAIKEIWKYAKYQPAPMYWIKGEKIVKEEKSPEFFSHMINTLSFAYSKKRKLVAITHTEGKMISFWNAKTRELVKKLVLPDEPRGICLDETGEDFAVTFTQGYLQYLKGSALELDPTRKFNLPFGVHIASTFC